MKYTSWKKFKPAWLAALRSGQYEQGGGRLCEEGNGADKFCCLGVAADLLVLDGQMEWRGSKYLEATNKDGLASRTCLSHIGPPWLSAALERAVKDDGVETLLVYMNDSEGKDFKQIANFISRNM